MPWGVNAQGAVGVRCGTELELTVVDSMPATNHINKPPKRYILTLLF